MFNKTLILCIVLQWANEGHVLLEHLTWNQLGYHAKPCGLLDVSGYYACLTDHLNRMVDEGFLMADHRRMVLTSPDPGELIDRFANYVPPQVDKWIELKKGL
ncbi:LOG family protein [Desulfovibrio sp. Fe33]|uniref:LOG family protein n=1 Tax=Desulfovibrio sp. Fe33 TaxID=3020842 RepID=UPI00234D27F6|nr:LOG family protein [Desulfovibrio sp. Fe33]